MPIAACGENITLNGDMIVKVICNYLVGKHVAILMIWKNLMPQRVCCPPTATQKMKRPHKMEIMHGSETPRCTYISYSAVITSISEKVPTGCSATDSESIPPPSVDYFDPTPPPSTPPPRKSSLRSPQKTPSKSTRVSFANDTPLKDSLESGPATTYTSAVVPSSAGTIRTRTSYMYSNLSSVACERLEDVDYSERESSVGQLRERLSHASYATQCRENIPVVFAWVGAVLVCVNEEHWVYWAASIGALLTSVLVFILPTMMYFRIGALCDFQSIPILGILPNKAAMFCIQIMGILFTVGNIVYMFYIAYRDPGVMKNF